MIFELPGIFCSNTFSLRRSRRSVKEHRMSSLSRACFGRCSSWVAAAAAAAWVFFLHYFGCIIIIIIITISYAACIHYAKLLLFIRHDGRRSSPARQYVYCAVILKPRGRLSREAKQLRRAAKPALNGKKVLRNITYCNYRQFVMNLNIFLKIR